jgi:hypothetical protein
MGAAGTGYLKAVCLLGRFCLGLADPGGPGGPSKMWGASPPFTLQGFPGPPGPARPQKRTQQNLATPPSGTQIKEYFPEAVFDDLPEVPRRKATFHD